MFRSSSSFDKLLDKATSNLKLEPDWPLILQICDLIRQGDVQPKTALAAIKKKMINPNPHVAMFALNVLESCVKNCGSLIHDEIGTKAYMEQLRDIIKTMPHPNVTAKLLELIQAWAFAFRNSPKYRAVQDTVNIMKTEGYKFPVLNESDAMFSADTAPGWEDGDRCHRCRVQFTVLVRKHHCRACGQVFCSQCTSKSCPLPKYGIEKEVRVCESCYDNVNKPTTAPSKASDDLPIEYLNSSLAQQSQAPPPRKSEAELKEEEELQLAIALSQSEAEHKNKIGSTRSTPSATRTRSYSPPAKLSTSPEADPDLARYLNRSYWNQQSAEFSNASAPVMSATPTPPKQTIVPEQNGVEDNEMEDFVNTLQTQVEIFVNRMKSNSSRGRSIANDSSVQTLFINITTMHSRLLRYIQQQDDKRVYFEGLQDKLAQVKDARAALDALREEHKEKLRREAEIAERQRQLQMAQKLDIMRKKKQEYLQYQRQLALQQVQEQERERQIRLEQQKQQYLMGTQYATLPYMRTGYDMTGRYPNPGPQSAQFPPYPAPPATTMHLDGSMPPGGPMMMTQAQPHPDQQGLLMHPPGVMHPGGMVPQGMMPMGADRGSLPSQMQIMGQRTQGPGQPVQMSPQSFNGPQSMQGPPSMPGSQQMPMSMPISGPPQMSGSQTLPRASMPHQFPGRMGLPPGLQGMPGGPQAQGPQFPDQVNGPQGLQGQMNNHQVGVQGNLPGIPQQDQAQLAMNGPPQMQPQAPMGGPQLPMGVPQAPMGGPQVPMGGAQPAPGMMTQGMPMGHSMPPHMVAQNISPMMAPPSGPQAGPGPNPQQQFQQPPSQPQPQNEDKTAELISFD